MKPRYTDAFWGKHPFDEEMILYKNKNKNKNKNKLCVGPAAGVLHFIVRSPPSRPDQNYVFWTVGGSAHHSNVSGLGILFENPLKSHTHCLPRVYHSCSGWLLIIGNLELCRFLLATLDCYSLMESVILVGVDNV